MKIDGETYWDGNAGKAEAYVCDVVSRVGGVKSYACVESLVGFLVLPDAVVSALCVLGGSPHLSYSDKTQVSDVRRPENRPWHIGWWLQP